MEFVCFHLSAGSILLGITVLGLVLPSRLGFFGEGDSHSSFSLPAKQGQACAAGTWQISTG